MTNFLTNPHIHTQVTPFDPLSVAGCKAWYNPDDLSTITHVSNVVSAMNDKSGEGNHVSQSTESKKPVLQIGVFNGHNVIAFDGVDDNLFRSTFVNSSISQPNTVFVLLEPDTVTGIDHRDWVDSGQSNARHLMRHDLSGPLRMWAGTNLQTIVNVPTSNVLATFKFNTTSSEIRINGVSRASGDTDNQGMNGITLGSRYNNGRFADIKLAELLVYDSNISGSDLTNIENYLMQKGGI